MSRFSAISHHLHTDSSRLGLHYAALFAVVGVQTPFWSVWLTSKQMGPVEIGILLGAIYWAKVVTNPLIAQVVDRHGHRRAMMIGMVLITAVLYALYPFTSRFSGLLIIGVIGGSMLSGLMPLTETITMTLTRQGVLDYGRVRLWGSISFLILATIAGPLLDLLGPPVILWLVLAGVACTVATVLRTPDPPRKVANTVPLPLRALWTNLPYRLFLITASVTQASHCVYYGFATLYWQSTGMDGMTISLLWGIGVVAEIILFSFSGPIVRLIGARQLVLIGALAGVLRWTVLATTVNLWVLFPVQILHAATFAATHLGAMHLISTTVDARLQARGQALYSSVAMGLFPGLALLATGPIYALLAGKAFLVAAVLSVIASGVGIKLCRTPLPDRPVEN